MTVQIKGERKALGVLKDALELIRKPPPERQNTSPVMFRKTLDVDEAEERMLEGSSMRITEGPRERDTAQGGSRGGSGTGVAMAGLHRQVLKGCTVFVDAKAEDGGDDSKEIGRRLKALGAKVRHFSSPRIRTN